MIVDEAAAARHSFELAFRGRGDGCVRQCECGTVYYDAYNTGYTWEEGELERLEADPEAIGKDYAIGSVEFEGRVYADACDCWLERADRIVNFIRTHDREIAEFLKLEKARKSHQAATAPTVEP